MSSTGTDEGIKIKLVLVGDTSVGKSALITNYLFNNFSDNYEPTVLDVFQGKKNVKKKQYQLEIHDTSGDDYLGVNRAIQYKHADCFMLCVAVNNRTSLDRITEWKAEIMAVEKQKPIYLILTKSDLTEQAEEPVTMEEIRAKKTEYGLAGSFKTSSKEWDDFNVHKAFTGVLYGAYQFKYKDNLV